MPISTAVITACMIVSSIFTIRAREQQTKPLLYFVKPLTTILIIVIAFLVGPSEWTPYFYWLLAGLVFCLLGDVFLMFSQEWFIAGLFGFLMGHIFYTLAFTTGIGFGFSLHFIGPLFLSGVLVFIALLPHLKGMRLPVLLYVVIICCMAWQAWERWQCIGGTRTLLAAVGTVIFIISDSILAMHRFRKPFPRAHAVGLSTYYLAQWLLALSAGQ